MLQKITVKHNKIKYNTTCNIFSFTFLITCYVININETKTLNHFTYEKPLTQLINYSITMNVISFFPLRSILYIFNTLCHVQFWFKKFVHVAIFVGHFNLRQKTHDREAKLKVWISCRLCPYIYNRQTPNNHIITS